MKEKSTFAGFLDGYKARNIAVSAPSVTYHFEEMKDAVTGILASQRLKTAPGELLASLDHLRQVLSDKRDDVLLSAVSCGEILKNILLISKQNNDPSQLLREEKMKHLIYHYLDFAELSEDKTVRDLAITIAEMF